MHSLSRYVIGLHNKRRYKAVLPTLGWSRKAVEGAQWERGAVGNAKWTGVSLRALLERAGMEDEACEIVLEGADRGTPKEKPIPSGPISFARACLEFPRRFD